MEKRAPSKSTTRTGSTKNNLLASVQPKTPLLKSPKKIGPLLSASLCSRPRGIPLPKRLRGSKAKGVAYEKKVVRELPRRLGLSLTYHQWIEWTQRDGQKGFAEPEGWFELQDEIILIECKLTGIHFGHGQMTDTYKPLLEFLFPDKPIRCLMICRGVLPSTPGPFVNSIEEFIQSDLPLATWHFLL